MSWLSTFTKSSIGKKLIMSLSGLFLITFLLVHLGVNLTLIFGEEMFNAASHFMESNMLIQSMQIVLAAGFIIHIIYGIRLTLQNRAARGVQYGYSKPSANTPINSRTMIQSGVIILLFLILHMRDFFVPMKFSHVENNYDLVAMKFSNPIFVIIYIVAFVLLGLHLSHGFKSAFQSVGMNHSKYTPMIKNLGTAYFLLMSVGFTAIAVIMFLRHGLA